MDKKNDLFAKVIMYTEIFFLVLLIITSIFYPKSDLYIKLLLIIIMCEILSLRLNINRIHILLLIQMTSIVDSMRKMADNVSYTLKLHTDELEKDQDIKN